MKFRKSLALILILTLCAAFLGGCYSETAESTGETLWVVTEQSTSDGMNLQAQIIAERLEQAHPGLTVQLEILPLDSQEREVRIKRLRTQIMAGRGPDVYLLPTGGQVATNYRYAEFQEQEYTPIEPLLPDVYCAMKNGLFADIQPFFEADSELDPAGLKPEIMDAGVLKGSRYVLPLRFSIPVILTAPADWEENGLNAALFQSSPEALAQWATSQKNALITCGFQMPKDVSLFAPLYDYDQEQILLPWTQIAAYMRAYQALGVRAEKNVETLLWIWKEQEVEQMLLDNAARSNPAVNLTEQLAHEMAMFRSTFDEFNSLRMYMSYDGRYWRTEGLALYATCLADSLESLAIAKNEGVELSMFPLRSMDGSVSADISYYGAVGSSCKEPELAYAFLRQFLEEEFQWDQYRPRIQKIGYMLAWETDCQTLGQVEDSWPVRAKGATPHLWSNLQYQIKGTDTFYRRDKSRRLNQELQAVRLTDEDVPALSWPIDEVRFPVTLPEEESFEHALSLLNEEDGTPTDVDIDKLSQQVYQNLWFHLMEG